MLIPTTTAFAVRCPHCGKTEVSTVSLFELSGVGSLQLSCSCGGHKLTVGMRKDGRFWLQIPCYLCDGQHFLYYPRAEFWDPAVKPVICAETDLQLGAFGAEGAVAETAHGTAESDLLLEDALSDDYFSNPEVMYQVLSHVHELAEAGNLTCVCGSRQVEVDIFGDRLELTCQACGNQQAVMAARVEDLHALEASGPIRVGAAVEHKAERREKAGRSKNARRKK